ncbi:MAG: hypothetical protein Q7J79_00305 [Gemmatimonadales bacterium]|nr:hypothetical protein [Gemmatimonadales bacterium]
MDGVDAAPTTQARRAVAAAERSLAEQLARVQELRREGLFPLPWWPV